MDNGRKVSSQTPGAKNWLSDASLESFYLLTETNKTPYFDVNQREGPFEETERRAVGVANNGRGCTTFCTLELALP